MTSWLLAASALLGMLAFFEPCTIATHVVYAERAHRAGGRGCCRALARVWGTRCLLLAGLLGLATWALPAPDWGPYLPSVALALMAAVYVVSRFLYLPVPHLAFHRWLPGGERLPEGVRLGLTLPACTLPLFLVVLGLALTRDAVPLAVLAGAVFATAFSLPMAVASLRGIHGDGRELMGRAARASPYLTALLLLGGAAVLLAPSLPLDRAGLLAVLATAGWGGLGLAFVAGFLFSFNPVSFASVPVVLAYVTRAHEKRRALWMGGAFVAGMVLTHVALGLAAALGGEWVRGAMGREWGLLLGPLLILLGLLWPGWLRLRLPWRGPRGRPVAGVWGAFLLGIPFTVAVCPFCTPALLVALTAAAATADPLYGAGLLLAFGLGRTIPVMAGAWSMAWLESLRMASRHQRAFETLGGVVLIATGLYLINEYYFIIGY